MKTLIPANVIDDYLKSIEVTDLNKASIRQVLACELNAEKVKVHPALVYGRDWEHNIIEIKKTAPTPDRFPRRAGVAEKKPL